ncbi:MAG: hypothetical protein QM718_02250 [Steroidobacteraceae bacterium]
MASDAARLSRRARDIGAALWASFLAAGVGTMFFFAFIAPDTLIDTTGNDRSTQLAVYSLGFLGLWLLTALASALTLYLRSR